MSDNRKTDAQIVHCPEFSDNSSLNIPTLRILQDDGTLYPDAQMPEIDQTLALKIYDTFLFVRALDERMLASQRQGRISFYMTETGEEAADIGSAAALHDEDMIMAQYREQGALAFRGFEPDEFMNQIFSNEKDYGKGRQMPIHYGSNKLHYMTVSSPLATQLPQATGYAYALKAQNKANCVICYFGDGAASEGDFHAALNMAGVLKTPSIFFCRNNGYAISTPAHEQFAGDGIAPRGVALGLKTIRVDGNDVLAVLKATQEARKLAVEQNQPVLIEAMTYRLGAHSSSDDPSGYRNKSEEDTWRAKCPVLRFKQWLIKQAWWDEEQEAARQEVHRTSVVKAMKKGEKVPAPALDELFNDVYDTLPWHLEEQHKELEQHIRKYPDAYKTTSWRFNDE
ncbi:Alpha keto acid dehydrogenase complex, E1 component, alpha subunit [Marinomonas sp. MED121]|uniref:thiamine pyrophosphate-dependent dehydrogenase E1 component subunit alpha n=1 Tax=Marinomonas sp. MED121 TaxID=314277 RepID=UPI0000690B90|nr:thiamine pyrophosphate-dependent dehydrogenase E1 component subunit alpha [Marinomonas sp. MED121]EAQ65925.1 Alpha keto acid dehydrogenase complex, E1 component, alpha subunit [Marinomonas sp. MED121]